jgi:hypothetical protein
MKSICASHGLWKRISAELVVESPQSIKEKSRTEVRGYARGESTRVCLRDLQTVTTEVVELHSATKKITSCGVKVQFQKIGAETIVQ